MLAIEVLVLAVLATVLLARRGATSPAQNALASAPDLAAKQTIDNIPCLSMEQVSYHVHTHLAVYVNGQLKAVPEGIGIAAPRQTQSSSEGPFVTAGSCFYWLHTHTNDGIIHIESPQEQPFTLGQFFDIWGQPLSTSQVGPAQGTVTAYVNGQPFTGDPRGIPLAAHELVQLDVGSDLAPQPFTFPEGL